MRVKWVQLRRSSAHREEGCCSEICLGVSVNRLVAGSTCAARNTIRWKLIGRWLPRRIAVNFAKVSELL